MNRKLFWLLPLLFVFSCSDKKPKPLSEQLQGEWHFSRFLKDSTAQKQPWKYDLAGEVNFKLNPSGKCDIKPGFFLHVVPNRKELRPETQSAVYLGTESVYKVENDLLKIYDRSNKRWVRYKILKFQADELDLDLGDGIKAQLLRYPSKTIDKNRYDAIIVSRSPCFGACPFNNTYLDKNGNFSFQGLFSNTLNDAFSAKLSSKVFLSYESIFRRVDIAKMPARYSINATDSQTNTISFIRNGKIVKTVESYIKPFPEDVDFGMVSMSYLYQKAPMDKTSDWPAKTMLSRFENQNERYALQQSEAFYLRTLLENAKVYNGSFQSRYDLHYFNYDSESEEPEWVKNKFRITTDGRFYKILFPDGTSKTVDLGYDFIAQNKSQLKPRD